MKVPSQEARADRAINLRADEIGFAPAVDEALEKSWRDGYAAGVRDTLAMLREPSDELVIAVGCCSDYDAQLPFHDARNWRARLRAAASALADSAGKEGE